MYVQFFIGKGRVLRLFKYVCLVSVCGMCTLGMIQDRAVGTRLIADYLLYSLNKNQKFE